VRHPYFHRQMIRCLTRFDRDLNRYLLDEHDAVRSFRPSSSPDLVVPGIHVLLLGGSFADAESFEVNSILSMQPSMVIDDLGRDMPFME
jgi:hypothetical protein